MKNEQALRLNTDYLEQRPNDQRAQDLQLSLLVDMSMDDELIAAIKAYQERDGYDIVVLSDSMTASLVSDDKPFIRAFAQEAMRRVGDHSFIVYQAHRSLLWAGDIDGASQLVRILQSSDLPEESRRLVALRQACAESRLTDAAHLYDRLLADSVDDPSITWISHRIMSQNDAALETLMDLDEQGDVESLGDFLSYAYFDPRSLPNLMEQLELQGVEPREPREIPYRCKL